MSKPEKQKSSGTSLFIDGVITKRVQTLGITTDITREAILELANAGTVEYIEDTPSVSIQIDTNDVGSTDTMALLTDSLKTYTISDEGNGPIGGTMRYFIKASSSNASYRTITESDMLNGYCSISATLNEDGTLAKRTVWMNHCAVTGLNLSYDVNGNAAENYTLLTDNKTWFFNGYGNTRVYKPVFNQIASTAYVAAQGGGFKFTGLDSCIPTGSTVLAIGINGTILRNRAIGGITSPNATMHWTSQGIVCTSLSISSPTGSYSTASGSEDRWWIVYKSATEAGVWEAAGGASATAPGFELESPAGAIGARRRAHIKAYLWNTGADSKNTAARAGKALRLQTVSVDVALGEDQLYELGTDGFYGISKQTPVPVTITVSANDSDLGYFAMLTATSESNAGVKALSIGDFTGTNELKLEIYSDKAQTTLLKTITINSMSVTNENFNVAVGDNASHEMTFTADNISIVGSGTSVTGGDNIS